MTRRGWSSLRSDQGPPVVHEPPGGIGVGRVAERPGVQHPRASPFGRCERIEGQLVHDVGEDVDGSGLGIAVLEADGVTLTHGPHPVDRRHQRGLPDRGSLGGQAPDHHVGGRSRQCRGLLGQIGLHVLVVEDHRDPGLGHHRPVRVHGEPAQHHGVGGEGRDHRPHLVGRHGIEPRIGRMAGGVPQPVGGREAGRGHGGVRRRGPPHYPGPGWIAR